MKKKTTPNCQVVWFDRSQTAWSARWVHISPTVGVLSFWTTWKPKAFLLNGIGALADENGVAVVHGAVIEEYVDDGVPQVWEGQGLQMAQVEAPSPRAELLVAQCAHPVKSYRLASAIRQLDINVKRFAA